ncbi:hypothetical protein [Amycolatopsis regifaucium]|uniref:hypothetical protein n=1 Tax=Amycolatopsis regifaucium TaxID=546365 RepID=UPI001FC9E9A9|nr:hypothetical protein [Amycolatopsis regifaucium]
MDTAKHDVDALLAVRQLMLEKDFDVAEASVRKIRQQDGQAFPPGSHLAGPDPALKYEAGLLLQTAVQVSRASFDQEIGRAAAHKSHSSLPWACGSLECFPGCRS